VPLSRGWKASCAASDDAPLGPMAADSPRGRELAWKQLVAYSTGDVPHQLPLAGSAMQRCQRANRSLNQVLIGQCWIIDRYSVLIN
jgi:hypothetical protein